MSYKEVFSRFWDIFPGDWVGCWKCNRTAVDIAHIAPKGMGGRASVEYIENYCPLCRECHKLTEGNTQMMGLLWGIVVEKIKAKFPNHIWSEEFKKTWYFKSEIQCQEPLK